MASNERVLYTKGGKYLLSTEKFLDIALQQDKFIDINEFEFVPDETREILFPGMSVPVKDFVKVVSEPSVIIDFNSENSFVPSLRQRLLDGGANLEEIQANNRFYRDRYVVRSFDDELYYLSIIVALSDESRRFVMATPLQKLKFRAISIGSYSWLRNDREVHERGFVFITTEGKLVIYTLDDDIFSDVLFEDMSIDLFVNKFYIDESDESIFVIADDGISYVFSSDPYLTKDNLEVYKESKRYFFRKVYRLPYHDVKAFCDSSIFYLYSMSHGMILETKPNNRNREMLTYELGDLGIDTPIVEIKFFSRTPNNLGLHVNFFLIEDSEGNIYLLSMTRSVDNQYTYLVSAFIGEELYLTKQVDRIRRFKSARY